jgi:ribonuclease Z
VFNHIVPPLPVSYAYPAFVGDAGQFFKGPITVGEDGMLFSLPVGQTTIEKSRLK